MYLDLALLAGGVLVFSCIVAKVERSWLTGPIWFIAFGFAIGPLGFELLSFQANAGTIRFLAEITLALVLFIDATSADLSVLRRESSIPIRMLCVGLPLTLLAGFGAGMLFFAGLTLLEIAILATVLAPTDAALGQEVVKNKAVPAPLRQGLNAESGLNDGICVPILYLFLALAATALGHTDSHGEHGSGNHLGLTLLVKELGIGLGVGVVMVTLTSTLLRFIHKRKWINHIWMQAPVVALAICSFALAQHLGGSGFIAAFCGGLLFGYQMKTQKEHFLHPAEGVSEVFALVTWVLFGATVVGHSIKYLTPAIFFYALLSLTLLRMLPIYISLTGSRLDNESKLFLGWFGPRGLASIVFGVIVMNAELPGGNTIITVVAVTVTMSVLLHGITAAPWVNRWSRRP